MTQPAAGASPRRWCAGWVEDAAEPSGRRRCGLELPAVLVLAGFASHPCCDPAEKWCLTCRKGRAGCGCGRPRWAQPRLDPAPRPPAAQRAARLRASGYQLCARPGTALTHEDLDAVEAFGRELAARRRPGVPGSSLRQPPPGADPRLAAR